ncbi:MAG TPA: chemotaxis protein CheW [Ignavibacteriales bacterium]|nr:chemotaxis protein CheW [Ignavibacteriales bacterium]
MLNRNRKNSISHENLSQILERLKKASELSKAPAVLSRTEKKAILHRRAGKLSQKISEEETKNDLEVIEFTLGGETYAVETVFLKEVFHMREITPMPLTPAFVKGIINLRGNIISVLDLRVIFGLNGGNISNYDRVIILQDRDMTFGILADEIRGIKRLSLENSSQSLADLSAEREKYLKAVTSSRVVVLDGGKLLNDRSLIVNDEQTTKS